MIKILLHGFFDPSPDLSPRTVSALALRALADMVYSGWDQGWDQKSRVIIYISKPDDCIQGRPDHWGRTPDIHNYAYSIKNLNNFQNDLSTNFELLHIKVMVDIWHMI